MSTEADYQRELEAAGVTNLDSPKALIAAGWLPPDEAERLKAELAEAKRIIRNAHQAIRTETLAASVALAMFTTTDHGGPSLLDELTDARAQLAAVQSVLDAARQWSVAVTNSDTYDLTEEEIALAAAVDALDADSPPEGPKQ